MVGFAGCHVKKSLNPTRHVGHSLGKRHVKLVRGAQAGQEIKPAVVYGGTPMSKDKEMLKDTGDALVGLSRSLDSSIYNTFFKNRRYSRYSATIFVAQILCVFFKAVLGRCLRAG